MLWWWVQERNVAVAFINVNGQILVISGKFIFHNRIDCGCEENLPKVVMNEHVSCQTMLKYAGISSISDKIKLSVLGHYLLSTLTLLHKTVNFSINMSQSLYAGNYSSKIFNFSFTKDLSGQSMFGVDTQLTLSLIYKLPCHAFIWLMSCLWLHVPEDTPHFVIVNVNFTCLFYHYDGFSVCSGF